MRVERAALQQTPNGMRHHFFYVSVGNATQRNCGGGGGVGVGGFMA